MPVGDRTPDPDHQPQAGEKQRGVAAIRAAAPAARATLAWVLALLLVAGGIGWLYLLRHVAALDFGPRIPGSLPLEQLAGQNPQPVGRVAAAWVPTGAAAGIVLLLLTRMRAGVRLLGLTVMAFVVIFLSTAASDAITQNERFVDHLSAPLARGGVWAAVLLLLTGSLVAELAAPAARRAAGAAATS
jgi:hypothetical protein